MNDRIELKGIRALGTIGVLPEEKIRSQPFEVDIWIETDLLKAGGSDDLSDTIMKFTNSFFSCQNSCQTLCIKNKDINLRIAFSNHAF